jgi:adenosylcobinamide kinase/adenosylcobinamide-phosphate guanylyltransferase
MVVEPLPERGLILISGPSRGGKSGWAEHLAQSWSGPVAYLATGATAASDPSWRERVEAHQRRRPSAWSCAEVGGRLGEHLLDRLQPPQAAQQPTLLLIDSLGTWLAWHLDDTASQWQERCEQLLGALQQQPGPVLLVVEETGWGVVPPTAIGGLFRDRLGALQQTLMQHCHTAWLVVGGRALNLISLGHPVPPSL